MKLNISGAKYSKITGIGEKIRKLEKQSNKEYLYLNQGINNVCKINIDNIAKTIDYNSKDIQVYPTMQGKIELRNAINKVYFNQKSNINNIVITGGGMSGLDLTFQTIDVNNIYLPSFYWGSYLNIMKIRGVNDKYYDDFGWLLNNFTQLKNSAVVICDPNNPIGDKFNDDKLLKLIYDLNNNGTIVIIDSPYRRVFYDDNDNFYQKIYNLDNVIIIESFSKSIGLSGQRIGFVHNTNKNFISEVLIRLMYATNGINAFSQILVTKILDTPEGKIAAHNFKKTTVTAIKQNIEYLKSKKLIAEKFFETTEPMGIFTIVNKSEQELLDKRIGSVSLSFFTKQNFNNINNYSRICVSVPHNKFVEFFSQF